MLSATLDKIRLKEREEGKREGREEGRREGKHEGMKEGRRKEIVDLLKIYLMARFMNAPEILEKLREKEDIQELESLASKIYQCQSLEEIAGLL